MRSLRRAANGPRIRPVLGQVCDGTFWAQRAVARDDAPHRPRYWGALKSFTRDQRQYLSRGPHEAIGTNANEGAEGNVRWKDEDPAEAVRIPLNPADDEFVAFESTEEAMADAESERVADAKELAEESIEGLLRSASTFHADTTQQPIDASLNTETSQRTFDSSDPKPPPHALDNAKLVRGANALAPSLWLNDDRLSDAQRSHLAAALVAWQQRQPAHMVLSINHALPLTRLTVRSQLNTIVRRSHSQEEGEPALVGLDELFDGLLLWQPRLSDRVDAWVNRQLRAESLVEADVGINGLLPWAMQLNELFSLTSVAAEGITTPVTRSIGVVYDTSEEVGSARQERQTLGDVASDVDAAIRWIEAFGRDDDQSPSHKRYPPSKVAVVTLEDGKEGQQDDRFDRLVIVAPSAARHCGDRSVAASQCLDDGVRSTMASDGADSQDETLREANARSSRLAQFSADSFVSYASGYIAASLRRLAPGGVAVVLAQSWLRREHCAAVREALRILERHDDGATSSEFEFCAVDRTAVEAFERLVCPVDTAFGGAVVAWPAAQGLLHPEHSASALDVDAGMCIAVRRRDGAPEPGSPSRGIPAASVTLGSQQHPRWRKVSVTPEQLAQVLQATLDSQWNIHRESGATPPHNEHRSPRSQPRGQQGRKPTRGDASWRLTVRDGLDGDSKDLDGDGSRVVDEEFARLVVYVDDDTTDDVASRKSFGRIAIARSDGGEDVTATLTEGTAIGLLDALSYCGVRNT